MQSKKEKLLMSAAVADGVSTAINVMDYDLVNFTIIGVGETTTGTVELLVSDEDECPTFSSAASLTNRYTVASYKDLYTGGSVSGATPYSIAAAGVFRLQLNDAGGHKWACIKLDWTAGAFSAYASGFDTSK